MPKNIPHPPHRHTFYIVPLALALIFIIWLISAKKLQDSTKVILTGKLNATVFFVGLPCPSVSDNKVPPCDGPYPYYPVRLFKKGDGALVASALTDASGQVSLTLPAGDYVWVSNEKDTPLNLTQNVEFTILANQTLVQSFTIDTGIR